jgi:hypothetical protein
VAAVVRADRRRFAGLRRSDDEGEHWNLGLPEYIAALHISLKHAVLDCPVCQCHIFGLLILA